MLSLFKEFLTHSSLKCEYLSEMKGFFSGFVAVITFNFRGFKLTDVNYLKPCAASFNCMGCEGVLSLREGGKSSGLCVPEGQEANFNFIKVVMMIVGFLKFIF